MSETLKWARDILDHSWDDDHDPIPRLARAIIMDADRLNVADTSPASEHEAGRQTRTFVRRVLGDDPTTTFKVGNSDEVGSEGVADAVAREIERWEALAATAKAAEVTVPQQVADISIQALKGLLARLRSGSEPGDGVKWEEHGVTPSNPERWKGYKGVGGEGGERGWSVDRPRGSITDLTEDEAHAHARILNSNGRGPADVIRPDGTYDAEHDDPPPGGEGGNLPEYTATEDQTQDPHDPPQGPTSDDMRAVPFSGFPNGMFDDDPPSGGEGAPEPDGWGGELNAAHLTETAILVVHPSHPQAGKHPYTHRIYIDRLPPERDACSTCTEGEPPYFCRECVHQREEKLRGALEREAEAREPDAMTYAKDPRRDLAEWSEVLAVRRFDPEKCKTDGSGPPWPVFFGTPGPDREREAEALEAAVSLMADREAEIRADERRKVLERVRAGITNMRIDMDGHVWKIRNDLDAVLIEASAARLSPTDEQPKAKRCKHWAPGQTSCDLHNLQCAAPDCMVEVPTGDDR